MTIAEKRAKALRRFNEDYIHDIDVARKIVNIYYRLVALEYRNLEHDTEENQSKIWFKNDLEKESRMYDRLNKLLEPYNLHLSQAWCHVNICKYVGNSGGVSPVLDTYFYD